MLFLFKFMQDLEKDVDMFREKGLEGGVFTLATLIAGGFFSEYISKFLGALFIAGGVASLWTDGYSPIKLGEELLAGVGKLACYPYDCIKKKYKRKEEK